LSYRVKYLTPEGWNFGPEFANQSNADFEYDEATKYYKFVQLVHSETVTSETVIREAQQ